MDKQKKVGTHQLLYEFTKTVEVLGVEKTTVLLYDSRRGNKAVDFTNFVIEMVARKFNMTFDQITDRRNVNNKRVLALKFISFYCYNQGTKETEINTRQSQGEISTRLKRGRTLIWTYIKELKKRKSNDKDTLQRYFKEFDEEVKKYCQKSK